MTQISSKGKQKVTRLALAKKCLIPKFLRLNHRQTLGHEVEEGELARLVSVLVNEAAGQVATEDGTQVVLGDLRFVSRGS